MFKTFILFIVVVILALVLKSCLSNNYNAEKEFLIKNRETDFSSFENSELKLRGYSERGMLVSMSRIINHKKVYRTYFIDSLGNVNYYSDEKNLGEVSIDEMKKIKFFIRLEINYIKSDSFNNVKIGLKDFEHYELALINDEFNFFKPPIKKSNFQKLSGKWYLYKQIK